MGELQQVLAYANSKEWGRLSHGVKPLQAWEGPTQPHISVIRNRGTHCEVWTFIPATMEAVRQFEASL